MINIFRKIRRRFFSNKVSSYLVYAIGEIVLVMIGILLALQVNNWNENRKQKEYLSVILQTVKNDLVSDTIVANTIIDYYKDNLKNSKKILNGEVTMSNYTECLPCLSLVTIYKPFNPQNKGYEQLKNYTGAQDIVNDSLINDINKVYSVLFPLIEKNNDMMENKVMTNFNDFEEFPWFLDMAQNKFTNEIIKYFVESEDYKTRVASHAMLAGGNHLNITQQYKQNAEALIERINDRLKEGD
ncbi:hypothetical protein FBALC1_12662 [Flavobacteriales bacterium ALC-1]|nr:hypothetical protein FBALC1_12662 [Flavobacteriales bacterium ALC-1]